MLFASILRALEDARRLDRALGGVPRASPGAILWDDAPKAIEAISAEHLGAGPRMKPLPRDRIWRLEPGLAALSPDDLSIEPLDLVTRVIAGARDAGAAVLVGQAAPAVEARGERVAGIRGGAGARAWIIPADVVVLANGTGAQGSGGEPLP